MKGQIETPRPNLISVLFVVLLLQDGLPAGFERLPSAMRPPVAAVVAARAKRHCRSASTGGSFAFSAAHQVSILFSFFYTKKTQKS
jgi:hypothetical protein